MNIRTYTAQDLQKCTATFIEVFNAEPWNDEWTTERATRYLHDFTQTPGFLGLLAMEQDEIVGLLFGVRKAWWSGDEFFIHEMCVKTTAQKSGIGSQMLNQLVEMLKEEGVQDILLITDRGIPAEEFYKKNGFEEIERVVVMAKSI